MSKLNNILLRRKNKIIVTDGTSTLNERHVATILKNIQNLGYTFSCELIKTLNTLSIEQLNAFYLDIIPVLKKMVGADVVYNPMYPNFPESVMEADDATLFVNAVIHYLSGGCIVPSEEKKERLPLFEGTDIKIISLGTEKDLYDIFVNLCNSKTSLSSSDKDDLKDMIIAGYHDFPDQIFLKENVALISKIYLDSDPLADVKNIQKYFRTATDVLRLITAMSDGDISLATNTKYRSFKRKERRMILSLLNSCGNIEEDMLRYKNRWIRIGERLHPSEFNKEQYKNVIEAFDKLRNNKKIETFYGRINELMKEKNYKKVLSLYQTRPGDFARKLDYLLRTIPDSGDVLSSFVSVSQNVSTPVLLQLKKHFETRNDDNKVRVFFPKGNVAKCHSVENNLPHIKKKCSDYVVAICERVLVNEYRDLEPLGNVYLSDEFRRYIVPFSQRSASKALKTVVRGSRFPISRNTNAMRGFIWWTNTEDEYVDIDLSAAIFDEHWNYMEHVSYTNLRSSTYKACHSGDITNGGPVSGDGVSEFLDVDIDSVVKYGGRYVVYQVYSYTRQPFSSLPHAMFGWMNREDVGSGEIYEPKTVEQKIDLSSNSAVCVPVIFDCVAREIIWCDMNIGIDRQSTRFGGNNLESNLSGVSAACYSVVNMNKPNLYELIDLHIKARGHRVYDKEDADIVFDVNDGITPYDVDVFMGEYI